MSFKPEVTTNNGISWGGNACRFATKIEAEEYVYDLSFRWTSVQNVRVVEVYEPVTCRWFNHQLVWLERAE